MTANTATRCWTPTGPTPTSSASATTSTSSPPASTGCPACRCCTPATWSTGRSSGTRCDRLEPADGVRRARSTAAGSGRPPSATTTAGSGSSSPTRTRASSSSPPPIAAGPWSRPHLLKAGRGLIDPCPLWDDDGSAYLVHAWASSRAGFNNRLTCHRMSPDASRAAGRGPDRHRRRRAPRLPRRWRGRRSTAATAGTGSSPRPAGWPPAGSRCSAPGTSSARTRTGSCWSRATPTSTARTRAPGSTRPAGQDWFLHFQDRGAYGRVVHLQPMRWAEDGWPRIGRYAGDGPGTPVRRHTPTRPAERRAHRAGRQRRLPGRRPGPTVDLAGQPAARLVRPGPPAAGCG